MRKRLITPTQGTASTSFDFGTASLHCSIGEGDGYDGGTKTVPYGPKFRESYAITRPDWWLTISFFGCAVLSDGSEFLPQIVNLLPEFLLLFCQCSALPHQFVNDRKQYSDPVRHAWNRTPIV